MGTAVTQNASIPDLDQLVEDFSWLDEWQDRYAYIIELGQGLEDMPVELRTPATKVEGCQSQVWLVATTESDTDPVRLRFIADSDAVIVRGLLTIILAAYSGRTAAEIDDFDIQGLLDTLGLSRHLSPSRSNGLRAVVDRIRSFAAAGVKADDAAAT